MDSISLLLLIFVIIIIIICIFVDLFRVDKLRPLPFNFRLRRLYNWFLLAVSYASMYIGRYNFTLLSHTKIKNSIGLSDSGYGWILTFGYWFYALVSPVCGGIGDVRGPKNVVVIGVIGSGVVNCLLGLLLLTNKNNRLFDNVSPVLIFSFFNGLNFMLQSLSTGSMNKINSGWYRKSERGSFGGIFSAILATAFFFTFNLGDILVDSTLPWNLIFIIPGILLIISGTFSIFIVKETPKLSGYINIDLSDPIEPKQSINDENSNNEIVNSNEIIDSNSNDNNNNSILLSNVIISTDNEGFDANEHHYHQDNHQPLIEPILEELSLHKPQLSSYKTNNNSGLLKQFSNIIKEVFKKENLKPIASKENILNALSLFCVGWVKEGFVSWFSMFLSDRYGDDANEKLISISLAAVTVGSMTGGFICGWVSDFFFKSNRSPSLLIFFVLLNLFSILLFYVKSQLISTFILVILFIIIFGINNVLAVTALLDLGTVRNAALMAGILTTFQYIASGFSGFLLGYIVENLGFGYWLLSMLPFSIAGLLMMAWNSKPYLNQLLLKLKSNNKTLHHHFSSDEDEIELK